MDINKVCRLFGFKKSLFTYYEEYLRFQGKTPIEYTLIGTEMIRNYVKDPIRAYSFISWANEMKIVPFEEDSLEGLKTCKTCAYLLKEIHGEDYFCGDDYTNLDNSCENHLFDASKNEEYLQSVFNR